jgi:hypothetical protein
VLHDGHVREGNILGDSSSRHCLDFKLELSSILIWNPVIVEIPSIIASC